MEANEDLLEIESEAEMEATRTRNDEKIADTIRCVSTFQILLLITTTLLTNTIELHQKLSNHPIGA